MPIRAGASPRRALLQFLPQACPQDGAYKDFLNSEASRLLKCSDDYLAHEFLDDVNEPCSFREFVDAARRHGLVFLAEAELPTMILTNYPPHMAETVQRIGGNQLFATEQLIDMVSGRTFRSTLLIAAGLAPQVDRQLSHARIEGLHFIGSGELVLERGPGGVTLAAPSGRRLHTAKAPLADALAHFVAAFPGSSSVDDLVQALPAAARNAEGRALVHEALFVMVLNGIATPRLDPVPAAAHAGAKPVACPMVRAEIARGAASTVSLRHENVKLDDLGQLVVPLLDGSRDAAALDAAIGDAVNDGRLSFTRDGVTVEDAAERRRIAADSLKTLLPALARAALLVG